MSELDGVHLVVYPARDLAAGIAAWTAVLGREPVYQNADYAAYADGTAGGVEIGLTRLPWAEHPLVFFRVEDIEKAHSGLVASGATALAQDSEGVLHPAAATPSAGIVDVPGRRLAVLRAADGNLVGIAQNVPVSW
jgi:catechol 2,3-dioxygenase-like lactoylglutathione lyase family enzyme